MMRNILHLPAIGTRTRFLLAGYGMLLIFWLTLEDRGTLSVTILGSGAMLVFGGAWIRQRYSLAPLPLHIWFPGMILSGGVLGAGAIVTTATLMFFKSAWHAHFYPDYPPSLIAAMLARLPVWALSGCLLGFAVALFTLVRLSAPDHHAHMPAGK
ncbi:MAG: hypothetical protein ACFE0Q_12405 [Anaerolineae bacterium]